MAANSLDDKLEKILKILKSHDERLVQMSQLLESYTSTSIPERAKSEHLVEQRYQPLTPAQLINRVNGRTRDILVLLINQGFHKYSEISSKLNITESRARAYISDLKNHFGIPVVQLRDAEGYKIGIDAMFIEQLMRRQAII